MIDEMDKISNWVTRNNITQMTLMLKLPLWIFLVILAALLACGDTTPTPRGTEATVPIPAGAATSAPAPEPTNTTQTVMTDTPATATPATAAATTSLPDNSPTPEATNIPAPPRVLAPLQLQDSRAMLSELSDSELACIGGDPEKLVQALTGPGSASREEQDDFIGCLEDETLARVFLAGFVPSPGPLSQNTSDCVRAAFEVIDPRAVMTAGIEGDPGRAMAGSMAAFSVTTACLTDQEWEVTAPQVGMSPDERAGMQCLMAELGGPGNMAEAMLAAQEGDLTSMANAGAECGLDMGPAPGQTPVRPPPTPTGEAPTPVSTPVTTGATPTGTPATPTPAPEPTVAPPVLQEAVTLTIAIAPIPTGIPAYSRSQWKHWVDADGDCQDARQEVLIGESLLPVTYKTDRECRVETGRWYGAFTGDYFEDPGDVDVDHMVPLKNAHNSGGWDWNPAMKEEYANNLGDDDHLIAVQDNANQSKGARGPDEWKPRDETYWCQYATDWAEIKERWSLTMTEPEAGAVVEMLDTCENPPEFEVEIRETKEARVGVHKPTAEPEGAVYGSCEEAESAGEQRVQGSQGGGRGYPKAMVPSARDGDGDAVVCER